VSHYKRTGKKKRNSLSSGPTKHALWWLTSKSKDEMKDFKGKIEISESSENSYQGWWAGRFVVGETKEVKRAGKRRNGAASAGWFKAKVKSITIWSS
jgi:hypothetical protein